jgi:hypothetical protein
MEEQLDLYARFDAHDSAEDLQARLLEDDEMCALTEFYNSMEKFKCEAYVALEIVGIGILREVFVWEMPDTSVLVVGWKSEDEIAVGVLAPGATFTPVPYANGQIQTLH